MTQELEKISSPQVPMFNFFDKDQFEIMQRLSKMFANSELVPDMYKVSEKNSLDKAMANCTIAISISQRIGADVLMVMQNLVVIYGKPTWSSKFLIGTVNTCGRFKTLQYEFKNLGKLGKIEYITYDKKWVDGKNGGKGHYDITPKKEVFDGTLIDNIECVAFTTAKGSDVVLRSTPVSIKLAVQEGWYTKAGSKWPNIPQQMEIYRTASFWTNAYAPELSLGMKTTEEVQDTIDISYEEVKETELEIKDKANKETLIPKAENSTKEDKPVKETKKEESKEIKKEDTKKEPEVIQKPVEEKTAPAPVVEKESEQTPPPPEAPANRGLFNEQRGF